MGSGGRPFNLIVRFIPNVALKPTIAKNVPGEQVTLKVPHEFQSVIDARRLGAGPYVVVAFPGMRGESSSIVDSGTLSRALEKVDELAGTVVVVAHNFTSEAREILDQRGAVRFNKNDFFWSDESLARVRSNERE
jgi:hypothetical protein